MPRPARRLGLAAVAALACAAPAVAFPHVAIPPVKLPPVKLPPSPVIRQFLPYVGYVPLPAGPSHTPGPEGSHAGSLQTALRDARAARTELADKNHLHLAQTAKKVRAAEQIVTHHKTVASADKRAERADQLGEVLKDLREADRQIAAHQVDRAREALGKAARGLNGLVGGPRNPPKKNPPKKN
jgi:hypothetical protein